jgi:hypothetical protein
MKTQIEYADGQVRIKLYERQRRILEQALEIGHALMEMNQPTGPPLVHAIREILGGPAEEDEE